MKFTIFNVSVKLEISKLSVRLGTKIKRKYFPEWESKVNTFRADKFSCVQYTLPKMFDFSSFGNKIKRNRRISRIVFQYPNSFYFYSILVFVERLRLFKDFKVINRTFKFSENKRTGISSNCWILRAEDYSTRARYENTKFVFFAVTETLVRTEKFAIFSCW